MNTPENNDPLAFARALASLGCAVFRATPCKRCAGAGDGTGGGCPIPEVGPGERKPPACIGGYQLPWKWQTTIPGNTAQIDAWRPGDALGMVGGHVFDAADVDLQNGGMDSVPALSAVMPPVYARVASPSGGWHDYIGALGLHSRNDLLTGVDYKAGDPVEEKAYDQRGHGFVFIPPTVKRSKTTGEMGEYTVVNDTGLKVLLALKTNEDVLDHLAGDDNDDLRDLIVSVQGKSKPTTTPLPASEVPAGVLAYSVFEQPSGTVALSAATKAVEKKLTELKAAKKGQAYPRLSAAGLTLGHYIPALYTKEAATEVLTVALKASPRVTEATMTTSDWKAAKATISQTLDKGAGDPKVIMADPPTGGLSVPRPRDAGHPGPGEDGGAAPSVCIVPPEDTRTSWAPIDLAGVLSRNAGGPKTTALRRVDELALFYPGRVYAVIGESEVGKTWIVLFACAQELLAGHCVLFIDFEDDEDGLVDRLRILGVPDETIELNFIYVHPEQNPAGCEGCLVDLNRSLERLPSLVAVDSWNEAMTTFGQDFMNQTDNIKFVSLFLKKLTVHDAAVVVLDHVPKNADARGKGGIGPQSKRAALSGATVRAEVTDDLLAAGQRGALRLTVDKDRSGAVRRALPDRKYIGMFVLEPLDITERTEAIAALDRTSEDEDLSIEDHARAAIRIEDRMKARVTVARESSVQAEKSAERNYAMRNEILGYLAENPDASQNQVEKNVYGNNPAIRDELKRMVTEDKILATTRGPNNSTLYRHNTPEAPIPAKHAPGLVDAYMDACVKAPSADEQPEFKSFSQAWSLENIPGWEGTLAARRAEAEAKAAEPELAEKAKTEKPEAAARAKAEKAEGVAARKAERERVRAEKEKALALALAEREKAAVERRVEKEKAAAETAAERARKAEEKASKAADSARAK